MLPLVVLGGLGQDDSTGQIGACSDSSSPICTFSQSLASAADGPELKGRVAVVMT